jgi:hypothetical protein
MNRPAPYGLEYREAPSTPLYRTDGPDPGSLGGGDQGSQEPAPGALAGGGGVDVDRMLDNSGHPAGDLARRGRDEPVTGSRAAVDAGQPGVQVSKVALPSSIPAW